MDSGIVFQTSIVITGNLTGSLFCVCGGSMAMCSKAFTLLEFLTFDVLDAADRVSLVREGGRVDGDLVII